MSSLGVVASSYVAGGGAAAPVVQAHQSFAASTGTKTITLSSAPASGSTIVLIVYHNTRDVSAPSGCGATWRTVTVTGSSTSGTNASVFVGIDPNGTGTSVSFDFSGSSTYGNAMVLEVPGVRLATTRAATNTRLEYNNSSGSAVVAVAPDDFVLAGAVWVTANGTLTVTGEAGSPFSSLHSGAGPNSTGSLNLSSAWANATGNASRSFSYAWSGTTRWVTFGCSLTS